MPRQKKSRSRHSKNNTLSDVTINDFANSSICKSRPKKAASNVCNSLKTLDLLEEKTFGLSEEKDWDDDTKNFDGEFVEDEDGSVIYLPIKKPLTAKVVTNTEEGRDYPIDIWFLISDYIKPEAIGTFAAICRTSYEVTRTVKFWRSLYKRYYDCSYILPESLKPDCLVRKYGLRTNVIRALYYIYYPFRCRLPFLTHIDHPLLFRKRQCVLMWQRKVKGICHYYFKMRINCKDRANYEKYPQAKLSFLEKLDDIFANSEEGCRILVVTCKNMIPISPVLGLNLVHAKVDLSSELRYFKLQMWFGSEVVSFHPSRVNNSEHTLIVLESVRTIKVLDWFHPLYPHSGFMENLLNEECDPPNIRNEMFF